MQGMTVWRPGRALELVAPALFAAAFVLTAFADTGTFVSTLWRPLGLAIVLAFAIQVVASIALRSASRGAVTALLALVGILDPRLALIALGVVISAELARRRSRPVEVLRGAAVIVTVFFALSIVRAATSPGFAVADVLPMQRAQVSGGLVPGDPDIYLILMDGYPRSDTLAEIGYDNGWFEEALATRGFDLSADSHSNYPFTSQVLASMFHARHLVDLVDESPVGSVEQRRLASRLIAEAPAFDRLQERGYQVVVAGLPISQPSYRSAANFIDSGHISSWEHQVLSQTALWTPLVEPLLLPQHRSVVLDALDAPVAIAGRAERTFMLTHVLSPHAPIVFDRNGQVPDLDYEPGGAFAIDREVMGMSEDDFWRAYSDQVHFLNGRILGTIDAILQASPDSVIVTFSDHGARATAETDDEWYRTFFAARTPGHPELFAVDARSLDIVPAVFGAYFGDEIRTPADVTFAAPDGVTFPLTLEVRETD